MVKRTAEEVCIEYAIAVGAVREQTRIMAANRCPEQCGEERDPDSGRVVSAAQPSCLDLHWTLVCTPYGESPERAFEDMCDQCQIRLTAFDARREAKKRMGAVKRIVERVGNRLIEGGL